MNLKQLIRANIPSVVRDRQVHKSFIYLHIVSTLLFISAVVLFFTDGYDGERLLTISFFELIAANILTGFLWSKKLINGIEFQSSFIIFAIQMVFSIFLLFPEREGIDAPDILMLITWIPLAGVFTYINYRIVKSINRAR